MDAKPNVKEGENIAVMCAAPTTILCRIIRRIGLNYKLIEPENCSKFFKEITTLVPAEEIKAIVFVTEGLNQIPLKTLQKCNEKLRDLCKNHGIFYHFPNAETALINGLLMDAKPNVKEGENIAVMCAAPTTILCRIIRRIGLNYKLIEVTRFAILDLLDSKRALMKKYNFQMVITVNLAMNDNGGLFQSSGFIDCNESIKKAFSDIGVFCDNKFFYEIYFDAAIKMVTYLMDKKEPENMLKYFCNTELFVSSIIKCGHGENLPFKKSALQNVKKDSFIT
uniref:Uncharacterized protein n=1 Tax=Panagrolaimus sp. ES5 TaxID=591445 RepID=A0AC34GB13_9BILA